ncbi:MAG: MFS family permease, partial [Gammaproteobacteria bacterium]
MNSPSPLSIRKLKGQGPMYMVGIAHGATHWLLGVFYILVPVLREDLGLSYTQAGILVSILHFASFGSNLVGGALVDVTGRVVALQLVALLGGALAIFVFGLSGQYLMLCATVALIGASNTLWHPPSFAFMAQRYPQHRGYALSIHATGASLGDMLAPLATGFLLLHLSWQSTAMLGAVPSVAMAVLVAAFLLPHDRGERKAGAAGLDLGAYARGLVNMTRDRAVLALCLLAAFRSMAQSGMMLFLPLYVADVVGANPVMVGATVMAMHLGGVIVSPIAGVVSDRIGRRPVVMAGLSASTIAIIALTFIDSTSAFVIGVSILGFLLFGVRPVIQSWMMDIAPAQMRGSATSLLFGTQSLFSMAMPLIGGLIADNYGLSEVFYAIAAAMLLANSAIFLLP